MNVFGSRFASPIDFPSIFLVFFFLLVCFRSFVPVCLCTIACAPTVDVMYCFFFRSYCCQHCNKICVYKQRAPDLHQNRARDKQIGENTLANGRTHTRFIDIRHSISLEWLPSNYWRIDEQYMSGFFLFSVICDFSIDMRAQDAKFQCQLSTTITNSSIVALNASGVRTRKAKGQFGIVDVWIRRNSTKIKETKSDIGRCGTDKKSETSTLWPRWRHHKRLTSKFMRICLKK